MSSTKDRDGSSSKRTPPRRRQKPTMIGAERTYAAQPDGDLDYAALCEEMNRKFPNILKRLAQ